MKDVVANWANDWGRKMDIYGVNTKTISAGQHDDLDAFRHAFCHAYVTGWLSFTERNKDISDWIGKVMENPDIFGQSATPCASAMDLHNNKIGRDLAPTREEMWSVLRYGDDPTFFIAKRVAEAVKAGETINSFDDKRMPKFCHTQTKLPGGKYVWRTLGDDKVRWEHMKLGGKIFDLSHPPQAGNPGTDPNCRCWAEPIKAD